MFLFSSDYSCEMESTKEEQTKSEATQAKQQLEPL